MAFWIFKCNPEKYRLEDRLTGPKSPITWAVTRYRDEIGPGDTAFIWVTGKQRGIRAVMRVDDGPRVMAELETEQPYLTERDTQQALRVVGTLMNREVNLPHTELREVDGLKELSVFQKNVRQQATNFSVTPEQGEILLRLIKQSTHP